MDNERTVDVITGDSKQTKQLIRQLKILNFWITFLGSIIVVALIVLAFLLWQVIGFVRETNERIESIKSNTTDSLNVKKQVCDGDGNISGYIKDTTDICQ